MFSYSKHRSFILILLTLSILISSISPLLSQVDAAQLTQAMVRLDRLATNAPLSGIICATPSSAGAGTESRVVVTFPSDFSISTTTTDWSTGSGNLVPGSSPWPGISSTALSVSGSTIIFSAGDLVSGSALYCFTFTGANSSSGGLGTKIGTVATQASNGTVIDSKSYATTITNDRIGVSAIVPANPTDFTSTLTQLTSGSTFGENTTIEYELTYGSKLSYATSITVESSWSLGTVSGSVVPTVELLEYVDNSATSAHNNIPGVVDPANRKITWTIPTFPGNITKSVRFALSTNADYKGSSPVMFQVRGRVLGPGTATSYSTVSSTYLYGYLPPVTPGPSNTPGPITNPTPQLVTNPLTIDSVEIRTITATESTIIVETSTPTSLFVTYGTSPTSLLQRLTSLNVLSTQPLTFANLSPNTPYYFRIIASDTSGRTVTSGIYTFRTAISSSPISISLDSLIVTSEKNIIFVPAFRGETGGENVIIVPPGRAFEVQFGLLKSTNIKEIRLVVRPNVLGTITGTNVSTTLESVPMIEIKPGIFAGRLTSKTEPGYSGLYTRVEDFNGNITEEKLAEVKVSRPFLVLQKTNNKPVDHAKVTLAYYNEKNRLYEVISPQALPIENPSYADTKGEVPVVLPIGKYRAVIEDFLYETQIVTFTIGAQPDEDYPTVYLESAPFSILRSANYILRIGSDLTGAFQDSFTRLLGSKRIFDLTGFFIVLTFAALSLFALSAKTQVKIRHLPIYFLSLLRIHRNPPEAEHTYHGAIIDGHSKEPVVGAAIFITDRETNKVVFHTKSRYKGRFTVILPQKETYQLALEKVGFHITTCEMSLLKKDETQMFAILQAATVLRPIESLNLVLRTGLGFTFELLLLISLITSVLLISTFGLVPVVPFLALAIFNMVFWMLHTIHLNT